MKHNTYIVKSWTAEVKKQEQKQAEQKAEKYRYYKEFKQSVCDMFTTADFEYYSEMTGLKYSTIKNLARYSPTAADYQRATIEARLISRIIGTQWNG
jgi:hypothetical protein